MRLHTWDAVHIYAKNTPNSYLNWRFIYNVAEISNRNNVWNYDRETLNHFHINAQAT